MDCDGRVRKANTIINACIGAHRRAPAPVDMDATARLDGRDQTERSTGPVTSMAKTCSISFCPLRSSAAYSAANSWRVFANCTPQGNLASMAGWPLSQPAAAFAAMLRTLFPLRLVVYSKRPFGGAEHGLRYLVCYTHRVAISNHEWSPSKTAV